MAFITVDQKAPPYYAELKTGMLREIKSNTNLLQNKIKNKNNNKNEKPSCSVS